MPRISRRSLCRDSRVLMVLASYRRSRRERTSERLITASRRLRGVRTKSFLLSLPVRSCGLSFLSSDSLADAFAYADNDQLLVLAKTFDPLSEQPLHTSSFGADAPVSVGWGHKSTQFHGSLGKSAAAAAAKQNPLDADWLESARDDGLTRIAWRGDSAWFAVNSLERAPPRSDVADGAERRVRRIRIYSRLGEHSSTSEPVPGLEGSLAWIPSGEIIASTQRKVVVSAEGQRKDELQVVFFERNGLRRYEFGLREERAEAVQVRELGWNAASDLLAVWIERDAEEAGAASSHAGASTFLPQPRPADVFFAQSNSGTARTTTGTSRPSLRLDCPSRGGCRPWLGIRRRRMRLS